MTTRAERAAAEVRRRHPDIPQDPLPLDWPEPAKPGKRRNPRPAKATRYVICPSCTAQKVAIEGTGKGQRIRWHWKTLRHGIKVQCPASGASPVGAKPSVS